jgi:hypothetical protein
MPRKINPKTIPTINRDSPERIDPEWVERRKALADKDVFFAGLGASLERLRWGKKIQWAWAGRMRRTRLIRLGIIASVPVADLAREFKVVPEAVYWHLACARKLWAEAEEADPIERRRWEKLIQWARDGRMERIRALRLGIIASVPVADLAREFKMKPKAVYWHLRELNSRLRDLS